MGGPHNLLNCLRLLYRFGGWIIDGFPQNKDQWMMLSEHRSLVPDDIIFLRDNSEGFQLLVQRYREMKAVEQTTEPTQVTEQEDIQATDVLKEDGEKKEEEKKPEDAEKVDDAEKKEDVEQREEAEKKEDEQQKRDPSKKEDGDKTEEGGEEKEEDEPEKDLILEDYHKKRLLFDTKWTLLNQSIKGSGMEPLVVESNLAVGEVLKTGIAHIESNGIYCIAHSGLCICIQCVFLYIHLSIFVPTNSLSLTVSLKLSS